MAVGCAVCFPVEMTALFVELSDGLLGLAIPAIRMYFPAFVPLGISLFLTTYLQAVVQPKPALIIMVLRGVVLPVAFAFSLPLLFGGQAIFAAVLCAEGITCAVSVGLAARNMKKGG